MHLIVDERFVPKVMAPGVQARYNDCYARNER
jgi:hypothetical protein